MDKNQMTESRNEEDLANLLQKDLSMQDTVNEPPEGAPQNTLEGVAYLEVRNAINNLFDEICSTSSPKNREKCSQKVEEILQRLLFLEELHRDKTEGLYYSTEYFGSLARNAKLTVKMTEENSPELNAVLALSDLQEFGNVIPVSERDRLEIAQRGLKGISSICADAQRQLQERFLGM